MTPAELEGRVDELARVHAGPAFVEAVRALAAELDEERRAALGRILLDRAGDGAGFEELERARERRWRLFRRLAGESRAR